MFELLETRRLFASLVDVQLVNGELRITGSDGDDSISVNLVGNKIVVRALDALTNAHGHPIGDLVKKFNVAAIESMDVKLRQGDDLFEQPVGVENTTLDAGRGDDIIRGRFGAALTPAHLLGNRGNDLFEVSGKFCYADGGGGSDTFRNYAGESGPLVDYRSSTANLMVDMNAPGGDGKAGENDSVEPSCFGVLGGSGDDVLIGAFSIVGTVNNGEGHFSGNDGNDKIFGGVGFDVINGNDGDDVLYSGPAGDDPDAGGVVNGGDGNDELHGTGNENEFLNGGNGFDTIFPEG